LTIGIAGQDGEMKDGCGAEEGGTTSEGHRSFKKFRRDQMWLKVFRMAI
jgi:hypothetical protein